MDNSLVGYSDIQEHCLFFPWVDLSLYFTTHSTLLRTFHCLTTGTYSTLLHIIISNRAESNCGTETQHPHATPFMNGETPPPVLLRPAFVGRKSEIAKSEQPMKPQRQTTLKLHFTFIVVQCNLIALAI